MATTEGYLTIFSPPSWTIFDLIELNYFARVEAEGFDRENPPEDFMASDTSMPKNTKNFPINWDELGGNTVDNTINLKFPIHKYSKPRVTAMYWLKQLPDLEHLLGAISTFYQQPITKAHALAALTALSEEEGKDTPLYKKISKFAFFGHLDPVAPKYY